MRSDGIVKVAVGVGLALLIAAVAAFLAYRLQSPTLEPPAEAVHQLLELRYERSTDTSAYARYFQDAELAMTLAQEASASVAASASAPPPIPQWEPPYVSVPGTSTARVVVAWKADDRFAGWPVATLFKLERAAGAWKIIDAEELTLTPPPAASTK